MKLSVVQDLRQAIADEEAKLESLRKCERLISLALAYLPPTLKTQGDIAQFFAQTEESERRLETLRDECTAATVQLADEICRRVHGATSDVLIQRYCHGKRFGKIASELSYSTTNIYRLHRQGVRAYNAVEDLQRPI